MRNNTLPFVILSLAVHFLFACNAFAAVTEVHVSELEQALKKGQLDRQKQTICTLTINSSEEKKALIKNLPSSQFQVVELATAGSINDYGSRKTAFLVDACNNLNVNKVKCDQVIISTHFGNHYWGESGLRFNIDDLEQLSCSDVCSNVLSAPKTKVAFACNMNSDDEMGTRSPEQMRADLIRDGLSSIDADQAVQSVHTAAGMSYRQRHNLIFFGESELIAFNKRAPGGRDMAHLMDRAFKQGMEWSTQNSNFIQDLNKQKSGLGLISLKTNSNPALRTKICKMVDPAVNNNGKLMYMAAWLKDKNWIQYYPRLVNLATQKDFFQELNDNGRNAFKTIAQNAEAKKEILTVLQTLRGATMKHRWAFVAWKAGWLNDVEFKNIVAESIIKFLRPPFPSDSSDRQDMVDEIGWMHKRYYKSNIDDGNIVSQFTMKDLNTFYKNSTLKVKNFFTQDIDLISRALGETQFTDPELKKAFEKYYGYSLDN
jgi:hypothetical protein